MDEFVLSGGLISKFMPVLIRTGDTLSIFGMNNTDGCRWCILLQPLAKLGFSVFQNSILNDNVRINKILVRNVTNKTVCSNVFMEN